MDEFPIGMPYPDWDLSALDEELEDLLANDASIYDANYVIGNMSESMLMTILAPDFVSASIFLVCAGTVPFLCVGLFRQVYVEKSVCLLASSLIRIIFGTTWSPNEEEGAMEVSIGAAARQDTVQTLAHKAKDAGVVYAFKGLESLDEMLSFILFYELYLCTCHMEARKQKMSQFVKKHCLLLSPPFRCMLQKSLALSSQTTGGMT